MKKASGRTLPVVKTELCRLLKKMTKMRAGLQKTDGKWRFVEPENGVFEPYSERIVRSALASGLVSQSENGEIRLTYEGRMALRRMMSAGDGYSHQHRVLARQTVDRPGSEARENVEVNLSESPLKWLATRKDKRGQAILTPDQVLAGERLRSDYTFAALMPSSGRGWNVERVDCGRNVAGNELSGDVLAARQRVQTVLSSLEPDLARIAVDVCCHLKGLTIVEAERGWPARSGKIVLKIALSCLADRYGHRVQAPERSGKANSP